jgi:membrane protease subunit HflK
MVVLYLLSGITIIRQDEVAVVLRWGRLLGDTRALQQRGPGLLFALPRPVDEVIRVPVKRVWQTYINTLAFQMSEVNEGVAFTLDPVTQGYALTGDHNIVHVNMVARYRVRDPAEWALYGPKPEDILRVEASAAMVRSLGEMPIDRVLADGRKDLVAKATQRAQAGLDAAHAGLELASLELAQLSPPAALVRDFDDVQSAYIRAETRRKEAQAFVETGIPQARADADAATQKAHGEASADLATAAGEAEAFRALDKEYRANPRVVRERLYRDAVEKALSQARVNWVPPPAGGKYNGFRVTIQPGPAGPLATPQPTVYVAPKPFDDDDQ